MSGLYGSLSVALSALLASQQALETSSNNVANANTPGFSRQRPVIIPGDPIVLGGLTVGSGVFVQKLQSLRDPILELRLQQETQNQGALESSVSALQQLQVNFSATDSGIGDAISKFFDSLQELSTDASNPSLRQGVLTAASNVASAFNASSKNLQSQRSSLDLNVVQTVGEVNTLTAQIAKVNEQIAALENVHQDAGPFIDQRNTLIRQLSTLIDVSVIQTEHGVTLTTASGVPLVAEERSFALSTMMGTNGMHRVYSSSSDVTGSITAGKLGGLLSMRDATLPGVQSDLDQLASGFANAINSAHRAGFDLNGDPGVDLFAPPPAGGTGAASSLSVAITDTALVAASSDGTSGSNGNIAVLSAVHDQAVANGQKPLDFYSNLIFQVGSNTANASADQEASQMILQQLEDQRASVSGVSLDEEASNMVRYQTAYSAAARIVSVVNQMLDEVVNLGS